MQPKAPPKKPVAVKNAKLGEEWGRGRSKSIYSVHPFFTDILNISVKKR